MKKTSFVHARKLALSEAFGEKAIELHRITPTKAPVDRQEVRAALRRGRAASIGAGMQADVYQAARDPFTVIKLMKIVNFDGDAHLQFLRFCAANTGNPFVPRIRFAKIYNTTSRTFPYLGIFGVEKLEELDDIVRYESDQFVKALFTNSGIGEVYDDIMEDVEYTIQVSGISTDTYRKSVLIQAIEDMFSVSGKVGGDLLNLQRRSRVRQFNILRGRDRKMGEPSYHAMGWKMNSKSMLLKRTIMACMRIITRNLIGDPHLDLHSANLMVRIGKGGPILVINDPVFSNADY